jgi:cell wall-associated NlpC family hydrolase
MPAAARINDMVYTHDPHAPDDHYGTIMVGSPNVFINEGGHSSPLISVPPAIEAEQLAALQDFVSNPNQPKYKMPADAVANGMSENYPGTVDTSGYKSTIPPAPTNPPNIATPSDTGSKFSFIGGNQGGTGGNNPMGGTVSVSWPSGWTHQKGGIVGIIRPSSSASVLPFLQQCVAQPGTWNETGMGGGPSNPTILNIWRELRMPQSGIWLSDQTAWCAGFVQYALKQSGMKWIPEAGAVATIQKAQSFGATKVENMSDAQPGDIVLWSYRHVNFIYRRFD